MTAPFFDFTSVDPTWHTYLKHGLSLMDSAYLATLAQSNHWLPGREKIFSAFSLPLHKVNYVLIGESPYPRAQSANGYAFWDAAVNALWSPTGLSKPVNRATSLRNIIKMLLLAEGKLTKNHTGQAAIAQLNKTSLVQTNDDLFTNFLKNGFLLLNATPVLQATNVPQKEARAWAPFIHYLLTTLITLRPEVHFLLLGGIAKTIEPLLAQGLLKKLIAEHPYNISFIQKPEVLDFFRPLHLLLKTN